jgi:23S rRNA (uracil1939-C5)-methyltransferase
MIARHDGRIVFVAGGIPGERVRVRVDKTSRQSWWATVVDVIEASPDRREPLCDPACGGSTFAYIAYDRQRELKQQILTDAFRRLGRIALDEPPAVVASPERGYRLRARLHAAESGLGFFLEGSHTVCDASLTAQLRPEATTAATALFAALGPRAADCEAVVISENVAASERVLHLEARPGTRWDPATAGLAGASVEALPGVTGVTTLVGGQIRTLSGRDTVTDTAAVLFDGAPPFGEPASWTRRAPAFFQGNRFLLGVLVRCVLGHAADDRVVDLYAGVGLFSVALAARGAHVLAVEGEPFAAEDLFANARPWGGRLQVLQATVEDAVRQPAGTRPAVVVLDPPRTGVSPEALRGIAAWRVPRLVYVSCDPPTLARDAAKFAEAGYRLSSLAAFDMFPNTPHVEAVAAFTRSSAD